jgi:hypothetical protein
LILIVLKIDVSLPNFIFFIFQSWDIEKRKKKIITKVLGERKFYSRKKKKKKKKNKNKIILSFRVILSWYRLCCISFDLHHLLQA